jgi:microcystin-dependent protein
MTAPTTTYKAFPLPEQGVTTTWGDALNNYPFTFIDRNLGGITTKTLASSAVNLTASESRSAILRLIGTLGANVAVSTVCQGFLFVENLTSGDYTVTLTNVVTYGGAGVGTPVTIPQGGRYVAVCDTTNGTRLVLPATTSVASTVGMIADFPGTAIPTGWLYGNGAVLARATYPALWTFANTSGRITTEGTWAAGYYGLFTDGDGSTTFRLPDLRGYFRRSYNPANAAGPDYGRAAGIIQAQATLAHTHTGATGIESATHTHSYAITNAGNGAYDMTLVGAAYGAHGSLNTNTESATHTHGFTTDASSGAETRPVNISVLTCIAYV